MIETLFAIVNLNKLDNKVLCICMYVYYEI